MSGQQQEQRLLPDIRAALICAGLTGFLAAITLRSTFIRPQHHSRELIALDFMLPHWAVLALNVWLYAFLLWLCIAFFRLARGKERIIVVGWSIGILLSPIQAFVSTSSAAAIQYLKATAITAASAVAVLAVLRNKRQLPR